MGVAFSVVDVLVEPAGMNRLKQLGATSVPVVVVGDDFAYGLDTDKLGQLLGKEIKAVEMLPVEVLIHKLDHIVGAGIEAVKQFPADAFPIKVVPNRNRSWYELGYHVFSISDAFFDCYYNGATLTAERLRWLPPDRMTTRDDLVAFGVEMREQLKRWSLEKDDARFSDHVDTYYGGSDFHELLERTAWHTAQHVRQFLDFLSQKGIQPNAPLTDDDLKGLPLPAAIWE